MAAFKVSERTTWQGVFSSYLLELCWSDLTTEVCELQSTKSLHVITDVILRNSRLQLATTRNTTFNTECVDRVPTSSQDNVAHVFVAPHSWWCRKTQ